MDQAKQGAGAFNNSHSDTAMGRPEQLGGVAGEGGGGMGQGGAQPNKQSRNGLHDPSYQKGGAQGAEHGDGLNADTGTGTEEGEDVGRGAD